MGEYGQYTVPPAEELVNFKVGQPASSMLPLEYIRQATANKFAETDPTYLQYGYISGYRRFRQSLAGFLSEGYSTPIDPERLFVTNGATGGIALICSLFCKAGDLVFLEEPSYFLALNIMKDFHLNIRQIQMEEDGLNIEALEELLQRGIVPKLLYTIPTCHNPTGRTLSIKKRQRLVELSVQYGFIIVADEVYQLLSFPHVTPPPPMFTFDQHGTVLAIGSFSKILAPALRLGWIQGHPHLLQKLFESGQLDSSGGINPVISGIVHSAIDMGLQKKHIEWTKNILWKRADTLMNALKEHLPSGTTFEIPDGGYFILVKLPKHLYAADLLQVASDHHKVQFLPGKSFGASMQNYLRLSFSYYDPEDLVLGAKRLGDAIREYQSIANSSSCDSLLSTSCDKNVQFSNSLPVAVHGASGRLGSLIVNQLHINDSFQFSGCISRDYANIPSNTRVVIDVTLPEGTCQLLKALKGKAIPLVIGTTGNLPIEEIKEYAKTAPVAIRSNFSVGVPLLADLSKIVANSLPEDWNVEISEIHHVKKLDAPSGTAKTLKKTIESTGSSIVGPNGVPCSSLRLGDEIGQHTVYFAGPGERIELKHQATRREVFAIGALRTAEWLVKQPNGVYEV